MKAIWWLLIGVVVLVAGPNGTLAQVTNTGYSTGRASAEDVAISWGVVSNYVDDGFLSKLIIENRGNAPFPDAGWTLYFNFIRTVRPESVPSSVEITHINGNFYKLEPTAAFATIAPGERLSVPFVSSAWAIKRSDAPSGFYFVFTDSLGRPMLPQKVGDEEILPFISQKQTDRTRNDLTPVPTASTRFRQNAALPPLPPDAAEGVIPTPIATKRGPGQVILDDRTTIFYGPSLAGEAAFLASSLESLLGMQPSVTALGNKYDGRAAHKKNQAEKSPTLSGSAIVLHLGEIQDAPGDPSGTSLGEEAYRLTIDPRKGIDIVGGSGAGVFYGIQSFRALLPVEAFAAPGDSIAVDAVTITDAPRFPYRGQHLDVARNFQPVLAVKKLLGLMAFYKLNTFHFHLTDDEGWRLSIEELPELTEVGARRGHTLTEHDRLIPSYGSGPGSDTSGSSWTSGSGYYTREQFIDILQYAARRHITVIPEIDVPGHARAAIVSMEARYDRLAAQDRPEAAARYRLIDPNDTSSYESVQGWDDNVIDVCRESTYRFMETVIDDIVEMYDEAGAPLTSIHIGGDEVPHGAWEGSPACASLAEKADVRDSREDLADYFLRRVNRMLTERGLITGGWQEVAFDEDRRNGRTTVAPDRTFDDRSVRPYVWANIWGSGTEDYAYRLANAGYPVVMSQATNFYFDMAYNKHPRDPGFYWAAFVETRDPWQFLPYNLYGNADKTAFGHPILDTAYADALELTEAGRSNIVGLQGQLWGETLTSTDRLEYMAAPRLLSLAERAWAKQPGWAMKDTESARERRSDAAWNRFAHLLGRRELPRLDYLFGGYRYRLPPPGAVIEDGFLKANTAFPGLVVRYTTDGTTPTPHSQRYRAPVRVDGGPVKLRTFSRTGRGSRVTSIE